MPKTRRGRRSRGSGPGPASDSGKRSPIQNPPVMPSRGWRSRGSGCGPASGGRGRSGGGDDDDEGRQQEGATRTPDLSVPLPPQSHLSPRRPAQVQRPSVEFGADSGDSSSELDTRQPWQPPSMEFGTDSGSSSDVDTKGRTMIATATCSRANPTIEFGADSGSSSDVHTKGRTMIATATSSRANPSIEFGDVDTKGRTMIATATSSRANLPPPPSAFVRATNPITSSVQDKVKKKKKKKKDKRKRKRNMTTISCRSLDQSSSKMPPPQLDMGKSSETVVAAATRSDIDSSEFSSPIRRPKPRLVKTINSNGGVDYVYNSDQDAADVFHTDYLKYKKKLARLEQLPTFKQSVYHRNITDWHDLEQKNAVLDLAESVLSLSSSHDGKAINHCTGFIIEWDEVHGSAIIVTSSEIICTKKSLADWKDNNVYSPDAKVIVHLWDGTTSEVQLLYFNRHYEIAFFEVNGGLDLRVAPLDPSFKFDTEACVLARDKDLELICRRTTIRALDPCEHQRNHYLFINALKCEGCSGGALANLNGSIVGMVLYALPNIAFLPGVLILKCFKLWKKFRKLARPHLGLKLRTVGFLDISHLDNLSRIYGVRSGLIVAKVSVGSPAERNGIRVGDIIFQCHQESISTITELEDILLDICEKHFEKGSDVNSKVDVELGVYNLRKRTRRTVTLSVELSDGMEVIDQGLWDE